MMEDTQPTESPPESYTRKKWGILFNYFDVNRDGLLDYDEVMKFPNRLIQLGKKTLGQNMKSVYGTVWERIYTANNLSSSCPSLTKQQWVDGYEEVRKSPWFLNTCVPTLAEAYFDSVDENQDGYISVKEWRIYQNNRGVTDEKVIQATFNRLDNDGDGRVSREEMKHAVIEFGGGEDPSDDYSFLYVAEGTGM